MSIIGTACHANLESESSRSSVGGSSESGGKYYCVFAILLILQLCPIWFAPYPALHDYPNHLARVHILHHYNTNESFQQLYGLESRVIPNLAMDLIVPVLMNVTSIESASKVFLSLIVVLFSLGLHWLGIAINGRPQWNALVANVFIYNFTLSYGFVNYMFGMGLFLITLALWLRLRHAWTLGYVFSIGILAAACYVSHLSAFVFLGISWVSLTAMQVYRQKTLRVRDIVGLLPLALPFMAYLLYLSTIQEKAPMEWWQPFLIKKLSGLVYPFLSYNLIIDGLLGAVLGALVLVLLMVSEKRLNSRELLVLGVIFVGLYFLSPMRGAQSSYVDRRFLLPAVVFLLMAIRIELSRPVMRYVLIGLLSLPMIKAGEVWYYWDWIGREVKKQVELLKLLPEGIRLYPMIVHDQSSTTGWIWDMHFFYTAHYATVYRQAFLPTLYAWRSQNTLYLRVPDNGYVQTEKGTSVDQIDWHSIASHYDYLVGNKLPEKFEERLVSYGDLIGRSGDTVLFRLRK